ncbi:MAG TPA: alpha/beta hydrolase [Candidatus Hydrogenedentes bacterium]|nr:alpha/beta hydrolase [Candidatus Hydrogenedentota bacterium]HOV74543.1 alpha/beta hydrolase [Candidatus Hydrogenedentota bacterium]HPC18190.1 alpha/beta hydrolase [Candidatus Hydrogenedentota bacterium]HRT21779.1 alpha/beta hydrolase [Candidatus Hydrogenedentota bacterium]HRT66601.1 alpha/beta hydrolase [Candidatus Hydrogenedentota bacterium]
MNTFDRYRGQSAYTVVLLHGHGLNRTYFRPLCDRLRGDGISHVALDLPGYGFARDIDCGNYAAIADYIQRIVDGEHLDNIVFAGYSYGGFISLLMNARMPDRVKGLVLMASSYEISVRTLRLSFVLTRFPLYTAINEACWLKWKDGRMDYDLGAVSECAGNCEMVVHSSIATHRANMLKNADIMKKESLREYVHRVHVPTLIIQPSRCQFFSRYSYDYLAHNIRGSRRVAVNAPHNIASAWDEVHAAMRAFLDELK